MHRRSTRTWKTTYGKDSQPNVPEFLSWVESSRCTTRSYWIAVTSAYFAQSKRARHCGTSAFPSLQDVSSGVGTLVIGSASRSSMSVRRTSPSSQASTTPTSLTGCFCDFSLSVLCRNPKRKLLRSLKRHERKHPKWRRLLNHSLMCRRIRMR